MQLKIFNKNFSFVTFSPQKKTMKQFAKKLRVYNISDLHLENYKHADVLYNKLSPFLPEADILILAGDIGYPNGEYGIQYKSLLRKFKCKYEHVVLVPGNHEYYQAQNFNRQHCFNELATLCKDENCQLLNNSHVSIQGRKIFGTTLWSQANLINDSHPKCKMFENVFDSVEAYNQEFNQNFHWLKTCLDENAGDEKDSQIIVTHHLPTYALQHDKYKHKFPSELTRFYDSLLYSEILHKLNLSNVAYYFCGHTHARMQLKYQNTHLIVNPYGIDLEHDISSAVYTI